MTCAFDRVRGQEAAVQTLKRALSSGHVHHAYRFEGPEGVGKELAAMAFAQALVCESDGALGCGQCSACHRAITLSEQAPCVPLHPDVVIVGRGVYKDVVGGAEATGIGVEQIRRVVLARAGYPPHEGRALCVIVRAAEELTLQAANALLKTLEEPTARTHFVLLSSRPNRLLDTVRSRTLAVRFAPLPDALIEALLGERGLDPGAALLAQGSMSLALELAEEERVKQREEFISAALAAIEAPDLASALALSAHRAQSRDGLREQLGYFAQALAARARALVATRPDEAERTARRHGIVLGSITDVESNVQPALALEAMITRLRRV
jgi:DNA polymerase III subunit delta'